jgi:SagB-type dehydrogenase family enzyme
MNYAVVVAMLDTVSLIREEPDQVTVTVEAAHTAWRPRITFKQVTEGLLAAFELLQGEGGSVPFLIAKVMQTDGMAGIAKLQHYLQKLGQHALLKYDLLVQDAPFASLQPLTTYFRYEEDKAKKDARYVISKFAYSRNDGGEMTLNSPLSYAKTTLRHAGAQAALYRMIRPCTSQQLAETVSELEEESALTFMNFLANSGSLQEIDDQGQTLEDNDPALGQWAFHDLLFHANNRMGRHADPYGGTFHFVNKFDPLPAVKEPMSDEIIPLFKPDMEHLKKEEASFSQIQEIRQSIREYGETPIHVNQLGEFLYRSARIKKFVEQAGVSWRPSPGGGAIHELEIYPVVNQCQGLPYGVYHYNPLEHYLSRVTTAPEPLVKWLVDFAGMAGRLEQSPQVLFVFTARFQRIQIKYQSVCYSVMLKDVGCLMQTMYLVATAMGLAPCALGGGDSDLFANIVGLDYYAETSVGEFLLGSGPAVRPEPLTAPKDVLDHGK